MKSDIRIALIVFIMFLNCAYGKVRDELFLEVFPKKGDGIYNIFERYALPADSLGTEFFKIRNQRNIDKSGGLLLNKKYIIPVKIIEFDGKSVRTSLAIKDFGIAKRIQDYNRKMFNARLKLQDFKKDKQLWVPLYLFDYKEVKPRAVQVNDKEIADEPFKPQQKVYPIFGEKYQKIDVTDNLLKGNIYYLVSGHGGPDPGAVGEKDGYELHEDEYAYDVTLRLARRILEHGGQAYIIVQDPTDGIRDGYYLNCNFHEQHIGGDTIPIEQLGRLRKRSELINVFYNQNKKTAKLQQAIEIHVDSRITKTPIDIFFYYLDGSESGGKLAKTLLSTIKEKYEKAQPGRGYSGTVTTRNLYMLRETIPTSVYIELGNIQNPRDQVRLIEENNRQAIANWLCDGLIRSTAKK